MNHFLGACCVSLTLAALCLAGEEDKSQSMAGQAAQPADGKTVATKIPATLRDHATTLTAKAADSTQAPASHLDHSLNSEQDADVQAAEQFEPFLDRDAKGFAAAFNAKCADANPAAHMHDDGVRQPPTPAPRK